MRGKTNVKTPASHPNLLTNWYFADPINQKEIKTTEYGVKAYFMDRWQTNLKSELKEDSIFFSNDGNNTTNVAWHKIEGFEESMAGKTFTLSALTLDGKLFSGTVTVPENYDRSVNKNFRAYNTEDFYLDLYHLANVENAEFRFGVGRGCDKSIVAVKLEEGEVQTLAHFKNGKWCLRDIPPNKAVELLKCQRYLCVIKTKGSLYAGLGTALNTKEIDFSIPLPCEMRNVIPTITFDSVPFGYTPATNGVSAGSQGTALTDITKGIIQGFTNKTFRLSGADIVAGETYKIYTIANSKLIISAEL